MNYFFSIQSFFICIQTNSSARVSRISFISQEEFLKNTVEAQKNTIPHEIQEVLDLIQQVLEGKSITLSQKIKQILDWSSLSEKERKILETLSLIPKGQTISYQELALKAGFSKKHSRFIGNVMAKNPFPLLYPCHRVITSRGKIGGYTGGKEIKQFLLEKEKEIKMYLK